MTKTDYFERHIPHRVNLLITFRERFRGLSNEKGYYVRDLFRCSKDSSLLMIRFFLSELGVKLARKPDILKPESNSDYKTRVADFQLGTIPVSQIQADQNLNQELIDALIAANRAVAHIINKDVDHKFDDDIDDEILFRVIDYVEDKIVTHIYKSRSEYDRVMKIDQNDMHRDRLQIFK